VVTRTCLLILKRMRCNAAIPATSKLVHPGHSAFMRYDGGAQCRSMQVYCRCESGGGLAAVEIRVQFSHCRKAGLSFVVPWRWIGFRLEGQCVAGPSLKHEEGACRIGGRTCLRTKANSIRSQKRDKMNDRQSSNKGSFVTSRCVFGIKFSLNCQCDDSVDPEAGAWQVCNVCPCME